MQGLLPIGRSQVPADVLAGMTLAALGIPEVLGYAKIAGMPVVTGLYTLLLPMAVFAVLVHRATLSSARTPPPPSYSPPR
jgi:sulfate permease, SulP family